MFLVIYPFLPDCPICWRIVVHDILLQSFVFLFKKRLYLFIFRQRGSEGEREGEKHQCVVASYMPPTGDLAHNPSMGPDWELNLRPFGSQAGTQSIELPQPGHNHLYFFGVSYYFSSFISDCIYLEPLFFLMSLIKGLSILLIFSKNFLISSLTSLSTHSLFNNMLFRFHVFAFFSVFFFVIDF